MKSKVLLAGLGLAIFAGCSTGQRAPVHPSQVGIVGPGGVMTGTTAVLENTPAGEAKEYQEIQGLFAKGGFELVISRGTSFVRKYPNSKQAASMENLVGLSYLVTQRAAQSQFHFKRAMAISSDQRVFKQYLLYNLAKAYFDANQMDDCRQSLAEIATDVLDRENRVKVHYLRARLYSRTGLPADAVREAMIASQLMEDADLREHRAAFTRLLDGALAELKTVESLDALFKEFSRAPYADAVLYRLASVELANGSNGTSETHARQLLDDYGDGPYAAGARSLLASTQSQTIVDARVVGVLLPLKGKYARFGNRSLQAIELAFKIFEARSPGTSPENAMTLVIEDSGDEPEQAVQALNTLVLKHHAAAVIGPLLSKGISQVTQRAQELGIPLVSLARSPGFSGDYIFQAGMTLQLQAEEIARFAIDRLRMKKFAILASNDKVGEEASQRFWDAVEKMGGTVVGYESYAPGETDFRAPIDKLVGTHYSEARARELELLAQEREVNNVRKRTRKTEQFFALKPLIDFDAVFVPDEPKVAGQILPTFAYRDIDQVQFLGTSAWNSPQFLERTQGHNSRAYFVDAFYSDSQEPESKEFSERYKLMTGTDPTAMEALAYDAAQIVESTLKTAQPSLTRSDVKERLKQVKGFKGATGKIRYEDGQYARDLRPLGVKANKVVLAN